MQNAIWMTDEHIMLRDMAAKFFQSELVPHIEKWREQKHVDREFWLKAGEAGLLGAGVAEAYGGSGGDLSHDSMVCLEHIRSGDASWGWGVHNMLTHYIEYCGTEEQKQRWLPKLVSGEMIGAIAMTEPGAGSDLQNIKTTAIKDGDEYVINGSKIFITNGGSCDLLVLVTKTDKSEGAKGVSLFILETENLEGFSRGNPLKKIGLPGQDTSELFFDNVRVKEDQLLGGVEGQGFVHLMQQLPWERLVIAISAIGCMEKAIDLTLDYVNERSAFGKPISGFQNTQFKLAEVKTKAEVGRAFVYECIEKCAKGELDPATASMAKLWTTDAQCEVVDDCLQLFGGYGYMDEYPIAQMYADARVQRIYGGTNEIMKLLISRSMLR